ncbi:unknown [Spodoptera litura nucleopolyhedrovirus II]|uniref:hypothetical protein n=1 Tax=Spodoptera litura nucleopolyhedrovirus II TaxID=566270 RepID=UPI0001874657|nr:hypothetical protein SlnV2_gp025 [Spodoptera litura nucleopolyhedrovirus II]ACI47394.1 unknown [Spodoptera litura nucleopolyhedrovirus II]
MVVAEALVLSVFKLLASVAHLPAAMATIRNKSLLRSLEQENTKVRQVPVSDLKKVSRAISILQQSNAALAKLVNNLQMYYERKYKSKVLELQTALQLKTQTIAQIEQDFVVEYLFVVKIKNCVYLLNDFEAVNKYLSDNSDCRVISGPSTNVHFLRLAPLCKLYRKVPG